MQYVTLCACSHCGQSLSLSLTHSLTHSLAHSLTRSLAHSLAHSLTLHDGHSSSLSRDHACAGSPEAVKVPCQGSWSRLVWQFPATHGISVPVVRLPCSCYAAGVPSSEMGARSARCVRGDAAAPRRARTETRRRSCSGSGRRGPAAVIIVIAGGRRRRRTRP